MNYLKASLIILVFFFHFSGITTCEVSQSSLGLIKTYEKIKHSTGSENTSNGTKSANDLPILKKKAASCADSHIPCEIIKNKWMTPNSLTLKVTDNPPKKATPSQSQNSQRKIPVSTYVVSIGTGSAALF